MDVFVFLCRKYQSYEYSKNRHNGAEQFARLAGREQRRGKFVPAFLTAEMADLPDEVVVGSETEPRAEHVTDAKE